MDKAKEQDNFLENISKLPEFFAPKYHTHKEIDIIDLDRMRWKGKWVKDTDYKVNDVVSYQNALYICMTDNKGEKPTSDFWEKLISIISTPVNKIDFIGGGGGGGEGTSDHSKLTNLSYAISGHIGFLPDTHLTDFTHSDIAHTNRTALDLVSGINTGDQDLSSYLQSGDNVSELVNDAGYLTTFTETDPVFTSSPAHGIDALDIANWNMAYGWGNHADAGYLKSLSFLGLTDTPSDYSGHGSEGIRVKSSADGLEFYTIVDTDEKVKYDGDDTSAGYLGAKTAAGTGITLAEGTGGDADKLKITNSAPMIYPDAGIPLSTGSAWGTSITDNSVSWNTAYGWGNHALAGYLTAETDPVFGAWLASPPNISIFTNDVPYLTAIPAHASDHAVGGTDTIFPADPDADKFLKWDDTAGNLVWADAGGGGGGTLAQTLALGNITDGNSIAFNTDGDVITDGTNTSIDPFNRKLYDSTGAVIQADYSTAYAISLAGAGTPVANSVFAGQDAGSSATNASNSNFFGYYAGSGATDADSSNFFGNSAGSGATGASYSNFFGPNAGYGATEAFNSNFFGAYAGYQAISAYNSNFFGNSAGYQAINANRSNFFGQGAGQDATNASDSNFFGDYAGNSATNAAHSNFFGEYAGYGASGADDSNFFGESAGSGATDAQFSNFFGMSAGKDATDAVQSNFFGSNAGEGATNATHSNFYGSSAGTFSPYASYSNFFGYQAGYQVALTDDFGGVFSSNFFGYNAGNGATNASYSNFFGDSAGRGATGAALSNFFGASAGYQATNAFSSNFFGTNAGYGATNAANSSFFGEGAGYGATNATNSNFFGQETGYGATNAYSSNFFGIGAGYGATHASQSNFFGGNAGSGQTNASHSIFLGTNAGNNNNATGTDFTNNLIIDQSILSTNDPRASAADIRNNALLFGTFADEAADQQLTINGVFTTSLARNLEVETITDTDTLDDTNDVVVCDKSSAMTVDLPEATGSGRRYIIKNINTGTVTVDPDSTETIDGASSYDIPQWESITVVDYASGKWVII